jgi:hypothetical protein
VASGEITDHRLCSANLGHIYIIAHPHHHGDECWKRDANSNTCRPRQARVSERPCTFCFHDEELVALTGFIKKTQKTPQAELDIASSRKKEMER